MAMVGVVSAVADAPSVVGHQDGGVSEVAHKVIQVLVVGEACVAAVKHKVGERPSAGVL